MYENITFLQIQFISNLKVNKTKRKTFFNYTCLMDFKLLVLCKLLSCFLHVIPLIYNMLIVKPLRYCETKSIFNLN